MKEYIGVKFVYAEPMSKGEFDSQERGEYKLGISASEQGYRIVYKDGYVSWSPKEVFEEAYKLLDDMRPRMEG